MTRHHDRRTVLARDRDDSGAWIFLFDPVAERRRFQPLRTSSEWIGCARHRDTIDACTSALVEPAVPDDARARRMISGQKCRMSGASLCRGVRLVTHRECNAAREALEAGAVITAIAIVERRCELIDGYGDNQLGPGRGRCRERRGYKEAKRRNEAQQKRAQADFSVERSGRISARLLHCDYRCESRSATSPRETDSGALAIGNLTSFTSR